MTISELLAHAVKACAQGEAQRAKMIIEEQIVPRIENLKWVIFSMQDDDLDRLTCEAQIAFFKQHIAAVQKEL